MKPNIGIQEKILQGVTQLLNALLADEYVLYTKTRNYHWNVTGPQFHDLHKFFEAQYEELNDIVDEVAERARALGSWALGSLAEFSSATRLKESPEMPLHWKEMVSGLLADHETVIRSLRGDLATCMEKYKDSGTSDFLTGLMEQHEKMSWMLRSLLTD